MRTRVFEELNNDLTYYGSCAYKVINSGNEFKIERLCPGCYGPIDGDC